MIVMIGCKKDSDEPPPVVNQPPVISGLNDLTLSPGFGTYELDFANFVTDQEGEIVTYQVSNSDESVITISLDNTVLTITEVGPGSSDVTVTATDGHEDHEVTETFTVTIEEITGAADYTGTAQILVDFNGLTEGSVFDNPIPDWLFEGNTADGEYDPTDVGSIMIENDHLAITHNVEVTYIWSEMELEGGNQDYTGKKFRFDYCFYSVPTLTGTHWEDDPPGVDIQIYFIDDEWGDIGGGQYRFSDMNLTYSADWQSVEIPLSDFESLWELPVDPSVVGIIGLEVWGGTASAPISFRIDNFGIVD
jgi:hypothetical protein